MEKISTGIQGLDEMLKGGFPKNRILLVRGGPGSGKTTLCMQFIMQGAMNNEPGIYLSMEEPTDLIRQNMKPFGWNLKEYEEKGLIKLIDASGVITKGIGITGQTNQSKLVMDDLTKILERIVPNLKAKRLAVDPITSAVIQQRFPTEKRFEIFQLIGTLRKLDCTSLISSELTSAEGENDFYVEEYLADGVIVLSKTLSNFKLIKTARIEKMRGINHDDQPRKYEITKQGIKIFNTESINFP